MSFRTSADSQLVQQFFRLYYERSYENCFVPSNIEKREFGYMLFTQKTMIRHLSFRSFEELRKTLIKETPLHVYRSAAFYQYPQAPMEEKGWLGAELIFDIDADHLNVSCKADHDYVFCASCGNKIIGDNPKCQTCGGEVIELQMVCEKCLTHAKEEMLRLIDFMENDFGLNEMTVSFSGNRGYHLSVASDVLHGLDRSARQEIVDYVTGSHINVKSHGISFDSAAFFPSYTDPGWKGRIAREVGNLIMKLGQSDAEVVESLRNIFTARQFNELASSASAWATSPRWEFITGGKKSALEALVALAVTKAASHIDTVVTTDVHRLLRLADTLNGKTGLKACIIDLNRFSEHDPHVEAVAFGEDPAITVKVFRSPRFSLKGHSFGPYHNEKVKLPAFAAVYLLCRGVATLAND